MINRLFLLTAATLALSACTQTQPATSTARLDPTGTYYETTVKSTQPVGDNMRNSTAATSSDRLSSRNPVGNATGSNPY